MNIFLVIVKAMFDCHIVKMPLETLQLLFSVHHVLAPDETKMMQPEDEHGNKIVWPEDHPNAAKRGCPKVYGLTHKNHPSAVWARSHPLHYDWLCRYGLALCKEFTYRRKKVHSCEVLIRYLYRIGFPKGEHPLYLDTLPPQLAPPSEEELNKKKKRKKKKVVVGPPELLKHEKIAWKGLPEKGMFWFPLAMPDDVIRASEKEKGYKSARRCYKAYYEHKRIDFSQRQRRLDRNTRLDMEQGEKPAMKKQKLH
jgi:hypothetical protein